MAAPESEYKLNLGHQEIDRVLAELEEYCKVVAATNPNAWLPLHGTQSVLIADLGYEDEDSFEDCLGGTFEQFIRALPHMETRIEDDGGPAHGQVVFRMKPDPPESERRSFTKTMRVTSRDQLWRVLVKAPSAVLEIPKLEFEIGVTTHRSLNSVYNHITAAVWNLEAHARENVTGIPEEHQIRILQTCRELEELLDVNEPWELKVHDPSGLSFFHPHEDDIMVEYTDSAPAGSR